MKYIIILILSIVCFAEGKLEKERGIYIINNLKDVSNFNKIKDKDKQAKINAKLFVKLTSITSKKRPKIFTIKSKEEYEQTAKHFDVQLPEVDFDKHVLLLSCRNRADLNERTPFNITYKNGKYDMRFITSLRDFTRSDTNRIIFNKLPKLK